MDDDKYIFVASAEACARCAALDGSLVPPGFKAHANCMCQTIPQDDAPGCSWSFRWVGNNRYGNGPFDVRSGIEVTVICSDGTELSASTEFDGGNSTDLDDWEGGLTDAAEAMAGELCSQCPQEDPFLCS
jgi:hypothetical protein